MMAERGVTVRIFGDYACFARPEFKVERVSYPIITPSAARGVLEAIFWKPEIRYEIREIRVLALGTQASILRNEISDRQGTGPIVAQDKRQRQQRTSLVLRNVAYAIRAEIILLQHADGQIGRYLDQFNRRVEKGQCHHTPYLGTREFAASFELPQACDLGDRNLNLDLGQMLFDIAFIETPNSKGEVEFYRRTNAGQRRAVRGRTEPVFFHARLQNGVLDVPAVKYRELYQLEGPHV